MHTEFQRLLSKTEESLNKRQIKVSDLRFHVAKYCQLESVYEDDSKTLSGKKLTDKLKKVRSVKGIYFLLTPFWSFLDYEILEGIINKFGDDTDKKKMADYKNSVEIFLKSWKVEPSACIVINEHCDTRIKLHLKLDTDSMSCYRHIKETIAKIFKLESHEVCLHSIKCGIVLLLPNIPRLLSMTLHAQKEIEQISPRVLQYSISPVSFVMHCPHSDTICMTFVYCC